MAKDYYQTLGVQKGDSSEDIRKAFKKLARKYHPDVNPGDKKAEERFKEISEAYDVLSDPEKRKKYDTFGSAEFEGFPGGGRTYSYTSSPFGGGGGAKYAGGFDFNDLGDMFGDLFSGAEMGAGGRRRGRRGGFSPGFEGTYASQRGQDLRFSMDLDFMEAVRGVEKTIRLPNGVTFKVKVPAGVAEGSKIRLAGKGEPGIHGGEPGDLYIEPKIRPHPYFRRENNDIILNLPVTITEVISGRKVKVPTIDGSVELKIPAGAQSGQKLRLRGKGVMNTKTKEKGDQYVVLQVKVPQGLDPKTQEALTELLKNKEGDPRFKIY